MKIIFQFIIVIIIASSLAGCKKDKPQIYDSPPPPLNILEENKFQDDGMNGGGVNHLIETNDNCFVFISLTSTHNIKITKTSSDLQLLWNKTVSDSINDIGSIIQTSDNGYAIVGTKKGPQWDWVNIYTVLLKLNSNGDLEWERKYGDSYMDEGWAVKQTSDGGYMVATTNDFVTPQGNPHMCVIKVNSVGDSLWSKEFTEYIYSTGLDIQSTSDSCFVIVGDRVIVKMDKSGNKIWGTALGSERMYSVKETPDGGYIAFSLHSESTYWGYALIKFDHNGNMIWEKIFDYRDSDSPRNLCVTSTGGFICTGTSDTDANYNFVILKTDGNGNKVYDNVFTKGILCGSRCIIQTNDNNFLLLGEYAENATTFYLF